MDTLPDVVARKILDLLSVDDKLTVAFVSKRWFGIAIRLKALPDLTKLTIRVNPILKSSELSFKFGNNAELSIYPHESRPNAELSLLEYLVLSICDKLEELSIESDEIDVELWTRLKNIGDSIFYTVMSNIAKGSLRKFAISGLELSRLRCWTLAFLVNFTQIEELSFVDVIFPFNSESIFLRALQGSFASLSTIEIINNDEITDKFARILSRNCPHLCHYGVSGCRNITALSVISFLECAYSRAVNQTFLHVSCTSFDFETLSRCISSPLLKCGSDWILHHVEQMICPSRSDYQSMIGFHYHLPLRSLFGKPFSDLLSKNSVPNTIISHLRKYGNSGQLISGRAISCLPRFYYLLTNIIIEQFLFSHHRSSRQSTSDSTKNFVQLQRKIARKRRPLASEYEKHEVGSKVVAIAVADSFDITGVLDDHGLVDNFHYACIDDDPEFGLHFAPKSSENSDLNGETIREFFLYSDGVVVFWDIAQSERNHILNYLTKHTNEPYDSQLVVDETDTMPFVVTNNALTQIKNDQFLINIRSNESGFTSSKSILERYAFSHGLAASVKIGVWESQLSSRAETLALTTKALSEGYIRMRRKEVLQMIGHFSDLRHMINLNCGLLDADFYWDHEQLERLYDQTTHHFMVPRRIRLLNNRLDYCENLVQLVDGMLAHRHASTLEWMIIILIVVEVIFDILHFLESSTKRQMLEKPIETK